MAKILVEAGTKDLKVGTPLAILVGMSLSSSLVDLDACKYVGL